MSNERKIDVEAIASDPRFMRTSPGLFDPDPRDQDQYAPPKQVERPPPGVRTGMADQVREAAMEGITAMYGVSPERAKITEAGHQAPTPSTPMGAGDRLRESIKEGLMAEFGDEKVIVSEFTYRSGKHVRLGDVCQDGKGNIFAVRRFEGTGVVMEHVQFGEMQVGQKFTESCLLMKRRK